MMGNIKYVLQRILDMDYRGMLRTVETIHQKTGRSRIFLFLDMVICGFRYEAGYKDYELCAFYDLTDAQRATYVTRGINNRIVRLLNDPSHFHRVDDKREFNRSFASYIHRQWLDLTDATFDDFCSFMYDREQIIVKPAAECCGRGIELLNRSDFPDLLGMYESLKQRHAGLIEEVIRQHPILSAIYSHSVNTYRIVTVLRDGIAHVIYGFIRIGNGGQFVDNINAGGMAAPIDLDTGEILYAAYDKNGQCYDQHPATGHPIVGVTLPYWKESIEMCLSAAKMIPQLGYIGWDIAVTENGPQLIEGNEFPGHDILQMPPHVPGKIGMLPKFRQVLPEL